MLPNMAAGNYVSKLSVIVLFMLFFIGLGSILFAISIDKPELNSGITHRPDCLKSKAEPIIEAPIPGICPIYIE